MLACALSQGVGDAGYQLGAYYAVASEDTGASLRAFQEAAKLGNPGSLFWLSSAFREGTYGVPKDERRGACYEALWRQSKEDKKKKFPDLDLICPLPPKPMP